MSEEVSDYYRAMKEAGKQRRASNREQSAAMLEAQGIFFTVHNGGAHLIVEGRDGFIDFWPGTGKWATRDGVKGFGVNNLINYIRGGV